MEEQTSTQEQKPSPKKTVPLKTYAIVLALLGLSVIFNLYQKYKNDMLINKITATEISLKNKDDLNRKQAQELIELNHKKTELENDAFIYENFNNFAGKLIKDKDVEKIELLQNMAKLQAQKTRLQALLKECYAKQQTP